MQLLVIYIFPCIFFTCAFHQCEFESVARIDTSSKKFYRIHCILVERELFVHQLHYERSKYMPISRSGQPESFSTNCALIRTFISMNSLITFKSVRFSTQLTLLRTFERGLRFTVFAVDLFGMLP